MQDIAKLLEETRRKRAIEKQDEEVEARDDKQEVEIGHMGLAAGTLSQPKPNSPSPRQVTTAPTPVQASAATLVTHDVTTLCPKVLGIQSLGANTVTIKDGHLIVQGPDHAAATQISQLLLTGAAKLANLNGKQVLLTTAPANAGQQQTDKDGEDPDKESSGEPENAEEKHSQKTPDPEKRCWKCKISDEEAELSKCHGCYRVRYKFSNIALSRIFSMRISNHKKLFYIAGQNIFDI